MACHGSPLAALESYRHMSYPSDNSKSAFSASVQTASPTPAIPSAKNIVLPYAGPSGVISVLFNLKPPIWLVATSALTKSAGEVDPEGGLPPGGKAAQREKNRMQMSMEMARKLAMTTIKRLFCLERCFIAVKTDIV
ncbi:hypothetical protein AB5N19_08190 [Seiridium cardinale]